MTEVGDPANHPTRYSYAASGFQNTESVSTSGPRTATYVYDAVGRVQSATDPAGNVTRIEYDALNRVLRSIGALNDTTSYGYDALFLTSVRDAKGQTYGYQRNALGWVEAETDPRDATTYSGYDAVGNVVSTTDRRGRTVTATYDALQLRSRSADGVTTTFMTDPYGHFMTAANGESVDSVYFDALGRPTSEVSWRNGVRHLITSTYDARSNRTSVNADGYLASYHYNALDQLDTLTDVSRRRTVLRYDADGLRVGMTLPMGVVVSTLGTPTHGTSERTYSTTLNGPLGALHTYDPLARLLDRLNVFGDEGREFRYDAAGRLVGFADYSIPETCYFDRAAMERVCKTEDKTYSGASATYTYDAVGNRTDNASTLESGNRLTHFGQQTLVYFEDGSLGAKYRVDCPAGTDCHQDYDWNSLGQLTGVWTAPSGWVTYGYDGWGRRIRRTQGNTGITTHFVYDGDNLALVADQGGGHVTHVYSNAPGVDRLHSVLTGGVTYYEQRDASGNVIGLVREDGALAARYGYDPYGQVIDSLGGGIAQHLGFKGREFDAATGLVYMRARWYDPALGRFISEDPIGLAGGVNPYAYAGNDPVNGADPFGLEPCTQEQLARGAIQADFSDGNSVCKEGNELPAIVTTAPRTPHSGFSHNFGNPCARGGLCGPGPGSTVGPGSVVQPSTFLRRGAACTAAAIDAGAATAGDLISLTGFGMVATRGTRGARIGIKLLRASEYLIQDRIVGVLTPSGSGGLRATAKWQANLLVGGVWTATSNGLQGESFDLLTEGLSLIPGINAGMAIYSAAKACF